MDGCGSDFVSCPKKLLFVVRCSFIKLLFRAPVRGGRERGGTKQKKSKTEQTPKQKQKIILWT